MARRSLISSVAAALLLAVAGGCDSDDETTTAPEPPTTDRRPAQDDEPAVGEGRGGVRLEKIGEFDQPVHVTQPARGDRALYVVERCGRIVRADGGDCETFLDLDGPVGCDSTEQGLLSLAFAPNYDRSGRFYVDYTDNEGDTHVVEYRRSEDDPATADPDSARELLFVDQPYANHNGGLVLFGPDGNLYIGLGDGGSAGDPERNGQDVSTLLGTILRVDPRPAGGEPYAVPKDNPLRGRDDARPEIIAYGFHNPWRFTFDRETRDLWIGEVGQDALEEIDFAPFRELTGGSALNFGWSAFEGTQRFNQDQEAPGRLAPVLEYPLDGACSVIGGYVVRDEELASLYGRYLYGDFCEGELRSFVPGSGGKARGDRALGLEVPSLSSFGEDAAGRVYATSLDGPVYRLTPK